MVTRKCDKTRLSIYCWFICVVTVLCLAGVVAWLSLTPKNPYFRISDAHFPPLDSKNQSTNRNVSVSVLNNSVIFDLEIFNPNKRMGIYYGVISLELYSGGRVVGTNSTLGFYQRYKNTRVLQIMIRVSREFWQGINGGNVDFMVRVETSVKFRIIKWKTKLRQIAYEEQFNNVKINLNGTVSGGNYAELQNASKVTIRN
ncbi:hypothetical protein DH2020_017326 [Rehmannia glutinosa]|uniref:Late embryogenesis abundant protein LEA-2 subgroup domain-containing protein n=1 Tax=Rehmannia glutinosa TaxID=99300 RepID=A0ABR0WS77_REHGL